MGLKREDDIKRTTETDVWSSEREELLRTHPGWFVAYQDGKRVALKPCEFHEIVERPAARRGPSPRLWPTRTSEIERG